MPAVNWVIEPVFLSRKPLPPDKEVDELEAIANNTLVSLIKQLSCLALISNTIFNELSCEVESINQKTERLKLKISNCHSIVANLNHKTVKVPLGTINDFMRITDHFKVTREMTSNLFTPEKRAPCIQYAYEKASISPINQFKLDDYKHLNGYLGSPFFADTKSKVEILEIEQQKPEKLARAVKLPRTVLIEKVKTPITVTRGDTTTLTTTNFNNTILNCDGINHSINVYDEPDVDSIYQLPSPKEVTEALAQEYPASFIPIDVSSFQRMSSFRRSLIHGDQQIPRRRISSRNKRANRRNTIHETVKSATTERPKSSRYNRERRNSDPSSLNRIDESCQTERTEEAIYSTGRIVSLGRESVIKRRSFGGTKLEFRAEVHREDDRSDIFSGSVITVKSIGTSSSRLGPNNLSSITVTGNSVGVGRSPSSAKDPSSSSLLTSSDVSGTSGTTIVEKRLSSASNQQQQQSTVEVKNYLTSDGIKMREGSTAKGPGDDGRSSSGNWSASSSTHASVDSDSIAGKCSTVTGGIRTHHQHLHHHHLRGSSNCPPPGSPSGSSLGKDSVLSESLTLTTQQDTDRGGYTAGGDSNGYVSDTSAISSSCALSRSDQRRPSGLEKSREETNYSAICGSNGQPAVVTRSSKSGLLPSSLNRSSSSQHSEHSTSGRSIKFANRDSESWLKYFDCSTETLTPEIITTAANETIGTNNGVCKQNPTKMINESPHHLHPYAYHHIHHHRSPLHLPHHPHHPHHQNGANDFAHIDDEVESVYSVDTDGYYTSMHTDSGLFRDVKSTGVGPVNVSEGRGSSVVSPSDESNILTSPGTSCNGRLRASSISSNSTIGDMSLTSMYSKTDTEAPAEVASSVASPSISPSHHQQVLKSNKTDSTSTTATGAIKKTSPVKPGRSTNKANSTADQPPPSSSASLTLSSTAKWTKRVVPPPPPVRMSSIRKNNSTNSKNTNQLVNSNTINSHSKSSESNLSSGQPQSKSVSPHGEYDYTSIRSQSQLSSLSIRGHSESEQSDKLGERVRSKTCIGSTDYPSLCNVTSSSSSGSSSSSSASSSSSSKIVSSSPAASRSSSDNCDHLSSNGASSADENLEKINEQSDKQILPVTKEKQKKSKKLFASYKPFKIKEIFSFGTLNKKSKISPVTSVDDRKGFMSYESICTDPKGESATTHCPSSRRSSGCESIPGYNQSKTLNGQNSISGTDLYKSQSIEKNLATLRKVDSNPYLPKPITDQGFFQSLLRTDFRSRSEEQLENDKNRRTSGQEMEKEPKSTKEDQQSAKVTESPSHEKAEIIDSKSDDKVETNDSNCVRPSTLILPYKIKQQQVKVELDSNGRLLYPSNSLGRRRDDHPMAYLERTKKMDEENAKWSTLPKPKVENQYLIGQRSTPTTATTTIDKLAHKNCTKSVEKQSSGLNESTKTSPTMTSEDLNRSNQSSSSSSSFISPPPTLTSSLGPLSSTPRRPIARIQLPQESNSTSNTTPTTVSPSTTSGRVGPPTFPKPRFNIYRHSFSGLGSLERRSAQDALKVNINSTSPADQPTSGDLPSPIGSSLISPGAVKSKLSTSDLISLIHDSKRRLGQRSANSSPSPITSPQSEPLPSPPNLLSPNQRRSWSFTKEMTNGFDNMIPGVNQGNQDGPRCRRSLCSDRLGPMRPTSIHDFKKLIAAARPVGSTHKPTFSAKDLLQAAPISTISSVNSPRSRPSTPLTTSPISMTNNLINEMSQPQQPTPSTLSPTISSSLPSPNSSTPSPQSSTTPPTVHSHLKVPLSSSPSPVSSSSSPSTLRDSRTRVINGRIYRSPYRLEVMCPPIEEDDIMEETTVNHNNNNQAINSSSTIPFQVTNDYKNGLTFIGSKEIKKHLISSGFYPNPSSTTTQPPTPTIKATSTWV